MQWFRKSLYTVPVNPHKSHICQHCNHSPNNHYTSDTTRRRYNSCPNDDQHQLPDYTMLRSIQNKSVSCCLPIQCIEIVDSEEFFADPLELKTGNYVKEKGFRSLSSTRKGLPVKPSTFGERFFLANFENDFTEQYIAIQIDKDIVTYLVDQNQHSYYKRLKRKKKCSYKRSFFSEFLFDNSIQMGLIMPKLDTNNSYSELLVKKGHRLNLPIPKKNAISHHPALSDGYYQETEINDHITVNSYRSELNTIYNTLACSIIQTSDKCWQENNLIKFNPNINLPVPVYNDIASHIFNIQQKFRLDDNGNILLNTNHIKEVRASSFVLSNKSRQTDKLYRRYLKYSKIAEETVLYKNSFYTKPFKHLLNALCNTFKCHPRNKVGIYHGGSGESIRVYTMQLAKDQCTTFARNIENFIFCTKESREAAPQVVMRNMRQFMNGMKNYLVKHGEGNFHQEVDAARARLNSDEFLNLDAILETVMHQLVVLPLREHLYGMFVDYYTRSEDIQLLAQNVKYACCRNAIDFGIRSTVTPPSSNSLQSISNLLLRLQEAELPLEKLDLFLCIISSIFEATGCPRGQQLGADDFLPILVFVVAKCGFVGAEIEAEFMWGLLQPTLLNGEPGYYLTALCSAVHVLKSFMASENENGNASIDWRSSSLPACSSVLRVIIPDECNGSLQTRTLPVRPHTTTREVCRIIAHKARITNPQDYGLFKLVDGEETILNDNECPQDIRLAAKGKHCMLAYKRIDAKIAWPTATQPILN